MDKIKTRNKKRKIIVANGEGPVHVLAELNPLLNSDGSFTVAAYRQFYEEEIKNSKMKEEEKVEFLSLVEELEKDKKKLKSTKELRLMELLINKLRKEDLNL